MKINIKKTKIIASGPITLWQIEGEKAEAATNFIFLGFKITANGECSHEIKTLAPWKKAIQTRQHIKMQTKICLVKAMVFPVVMGCERQTIRKAKYWRTDAFKLWWWRTLESPLDCKEIKPVNSKENQPWKFIGTTEAAAPTLWPCDAKRWLTGKDPDPGKDSRQKEKPAVKEDG